MGIQAALELLPAGDVCPPGQEPQVLGSDTVFDVAPAIEYLPLGQLTIPEHVDVTSPAELPKKPEGHNAHTDSSLILPVVAPLFAYFPEKHVTVPVHEDEVPPPVPKTPAGHGVHDEPVNEDND